MFGSRILHGIRFSNALVLRRRFIPPWERDGKSADAFFAGLMTSTNPIQQQRRETQRAEAAQEIAFAKEKLTLEEERRMHELANLNERMMETKRDFLPYGARPKMYFDASQMAAWGEYQSNLRRPQATLSSDYIEQGLNGTENPGYSEEIKTLLADDMASKIPYRYTQYVPPPLSGEALQWPLHGTVGLVFDIDGVVHRGQWIIPGADAAIRTLQELHIPFVFMTNGGSYSEAEKARSLSSLLGCEIDVKQVILAHSPMRLMAPQYRWEPVVVAGPPCCAAVAREYGFERAIGILQYQAEHPEMFPYKKWNSIPACKVSKMGTVPFPQIGAVFQFSDPDDAFSDIQAMLDLFSSPYGQVGSYVSGVQSIPFYMASDDLLWATEAPLPRIGQGAYREMLSSVFESVTGQGLQVTMYGKPRAIAYAYAEKRLKSVSEALGWKVSDMRAIFMVGDNLETDIVGANAAGGLWTSVHVLSGISRAPAAGRTLSEGDTECEWLETCVSKVPHYVAPTMDHFVRELLAFPEKALLQHKVPFYGRMNPIDLKETYNFDL